VGGRSRRHQHSTGDRRSGGGDGEACAVAHLRRCSGDRGTCALEQVRGRVEVDQLATSSRAGYDNSLRTYRDRNCRMGMSCAMTKDNAANWNRRNCLWIWARRACPAGTDTRAARARLRSPRCCRRQGRPNGDA
jgi:hypothetical protein